MAATSSRTRGGSRTSAVTSRRSSGRSPTACRSPATSPGRCSTTSSGSTAIRSASGWSTSTTRRRSGSRRRARSGTATTSRAPRTDGRSASAPASKSQGVPGGARRRHATSSVGPISPHIWPPCVLAWHHRAVAGNARPSLAGALMAAVTLDEVSKVFPDGTIAVDELSLDVADGEFLVLVGPSGSGKSTALRIVAGLEDATSGEVLIGGKVVTGLEPRRRDVAMVFQNYALYPHMDVRRNLAFGLKLRRVPKPEITSRVGDTASMLAIGELLHRRPRQLSGGQRQRVAMGRAIVREPQAFLMDEPLS